MNDDTNQREVGPLQAVALGPSEAVALSGRRYCLCLEAIADRGEADRVRRLPRAQHGVHRATECEPDTLVVTKLDRLARSLPDARDIPEDLTKREVKLSIGGSVHDPTDPVGRLLFNVLAMLPNSSLT